MIKRKPKFIGTISTSLQKSVDLANYELSWFEKKSPSIINWIKTALEQEKLAYRLPDNIIPYGTLLHFEDKFRFNGKVTINATVKSATDKIVLHIDQPDNDPKDVKVSQLGEWEGASKQLNVVDVSGMEKYYSTNIQLKDTIGANSTITIEIR